MFSSTANAARNYANVGVTTGVMAADPHGLVVMLFDGATAAVAAARTHLQAHRLPEKAKAISRAVSIIQDGLMASLDRAGGGELAQRLFSLYEYMVVRLSEANARNLDAPLEETGRLLAELGGAWKSMGESHAQPGAAASGGDHDQ